MRVFAQAFDWVGDPREYSLEAIMAHECGHQVFHRHRWLRRWFGSELSESREEVIASLIGALLVASVSDHDALRDKAVGDALMAGMSLTEAAAFIAGINQALEIALC